MSAPWYRSTDLARWGASNSGGDLSATQFDENTWYFQQQIQTLLADVATIPAGIAFFTLVGNQLTVTLTDHTTRGPYTIPTLAFNFRGPWAPTTVYAVNDVFTINGSVYLVLFAHTSAGSFSAGANDGMGHNYYGLMISLPANSLPTGGTVVPRAFLAKNTTTDFDVGWYYPLPTGGNTGQILSKNSNANQDAHWENFPGIVVPPASPAGLAHEVLSTVDGSDTNTRWVKVVYSPPSSGAAGQVPATNDGTNINMEWISTVWAPPASPGGNTNQGLVTTDGSPENMAWQTLVWAPPPSPAGSAGQILATVDGTPENMQWVDSGTGTDAIEFIIDGGGGTISTGLKGYIHVPFGATITGVTLLGDRTGSIVVDVWMVIYSVFNPPGSVPSSGNSICASALPTISSTYKSQDTTLTGWTTSIAAGNILAFNVNSVSSMQRVTVSLTVTK